MMLLPALITVAAFLLNVAFNAAFIALMGFKVRKNLKIRHLHVHLPSC